MDEIICKDMINQLDILCQQSVVMAVHVFKYLLLVLIKYIQLRKTYKKEDKHCGWDQGIHVHYFGEKEIALTLSKGWNESFVSHSFYVQ